METNTLLQMGLVAIASGIGAWAAIKIEIKYLRRDIDHAHQRIDFLTGVKTK